MEHILIVDDSIMVRTAAANLLKQYYKVSTAKNGFEAIEFSGNHKVDLILLDIEMPVMDGLETLKRMKCDGHLGSVPVIFLTGLTQPEIEENCLKLGARDFIAKPFHGPVMLRRIQRVLELEALKKNLEEQVAKKTEELEKLTEQTITTFANSIDAKDRYTKNHSYHVAKYAEQIGKVLGWDKTDIRNLYYSALLHDIGKIAVPDFILNKPGELTEEEFTIIKKHPETGGQILKDVSVVPRLGDGASNHHERYDGRGYPKGKKGEEIPIVGRIVGIADAVDAMASDRSYRKGRPASEIIEELKRCRGTQFDPFLVDIMCAILENGTDFLEDGSKAANQPGELLMTFINEYKKASCMDNATGLWNRGYMEEQVNERIQNHRGSGAMIMLEVDGFNSYNEKWGHLMGHGLLQVIAETICVGLVEDDIACRLSNNGFLIYYTNIEGRMEVEKKVLELCDKIHKRLAEYEFTESDVSAGIALRPEDGNDFVSLYHNADKSLYFVKKKAENSFYFYSGDDEAAIERRVWKEI